MVHWIHVAAVAATMGSIATLFLVFMWRRCHHKKDHLDQRSKKQGNFFVFHNGRGALFSWGDHPYLAADAVENGWSRFAFTSYNSNMSSSSPSSKTSTLLGACAGGENGRESEAEISWDVCQGSSEFMQKIRLNSGLKKNFNPNYNTSYSMSAASSVIRAALPLPGPPLGNYAFPQEAYFEITILYSQGDDHDQVVGKREGEKTKLLIQDGSNAKSNLDNVEDMKLDGKEGGKSGGSVMFSLGLTAGGAIPLRIPGTYPRSIGFNSNGSVFLDGMKLVLESEKAQWVGTNTVAGCGFDPRMKKVFFTLGSELVHVIHCQSVEFGTPLFPTLAANTDIEVLVNFGQSAFKYAPANANRTPNPCFIAPLVYSSGATLGYDDSKELFSMGRIDSQWLNQSTPKGNHSNNVNNNRASEFDEESEADLFEIVLDGSEKSPKS